MSKTAIIGDRIPVLKQALGISATSELERGGFPPEKPLLKNGQISKWVGKPVDWTTGKLEAFLNHYMVNRQWWKAGEGEVLLKNGTPVPNQPAIKQNPRPLDLGEAIRIIVEGSEYYIIPKVALEGKYRLMPIEEITIKEKELERRNDELIRKDHQITGLYELVKVIASGATLPKIEDAQKNTGV